MKPAQSGFSSGGIGSLSPVALASVLDQSMDCVKLVGLNGEVQYMNANGMRAMEIDSFSMIRGKAWADLWPEEARATIRASYGSAANGETVRFKAFCPTAKGSPRWWDVSVSGVVDAEGRQAGYLSVSRDITETETAREALEIAAAELRHRLMNTYTMIGSLLLSYARGHGAHEAFARDMSSRLSALSKAQSLFAVDDSPCELDRLVPALLEPFDSIACPIRIGLLPSVCVSRGKADAIALVIGELAVNSAKHGALAHGGELVIDAELTPGRVTVLWQETCLQAVKAQSREGGQGMKLIDRIVRARRGKFDISWRANGLDVVISFDLAE